MSEDTRIEWADATFNPWSGCARVSPACANCYAAVLPDSMRRGAKWGPNEPRVPAGDAYWQHPLAWDRAAARTGVPRRVFCASVADVFEDRADLDPLRERLWDLIGKTPHLRWLLLTKRPEVMLRHADRFAAYPTAWAGVTVEDQQRANERLPLLLRVPARVRFVSMEPLLGPVDLACVLEHGDRYISVINALTGFHGTAGGGWTGNRLDWVIAGGESGRRARPSPLPLFTALRDQCVAARVPFLFKQWGEWAPRTVSSQVDAEIHGDSKAAEWSGDRWLGETREAWSMFKVGKTAAGRLLEGREWLEFPSMEVPR